jgi:Flp pilus assembly CpaF family ATPase
MDMAIFAAPLRAFQNEAAKLFREMNTGHKA